MSSSLPYTRSEAKQWAAETFHGACNVIIPSYSSDLRSLNEAGIRHDVRRNIELGFWGTLLVSEGGTTADEMRRFMEIAVDEAAGRQRSSSRERSTPSPTPWGWPKTAPPSGWTPCC